MRAGVALALVCGAVLLLATNGTLLCLSAYLGVLLPPQTWWHGTKYEVRRSALANPSLHLLPPLIWAVRGGHNGTVLSLLQHGARIEQRDGFGGTALIRASEWDEVEIVNALLDRGADVMASDNQGHTALHLAAAYGSQACCDRLIVHGANVNATDVLENTPLTLACARADGDSIAELLIQAHADICKRDHRGLSPVVIAAMYGNCKTLRVLLEHDAAPCITASDMQQAITEAARFKHDAAVAILRQSTK